MGTCCLKIADQYNERCKEYYRQDNAKDYAYITADEFTGSQVVACEKLILEVCGFRVLQNTAWHSLQGRGSALALYLSDLSLLCTRIRGQFDS